MQRITLDSCPDLWWHFPHYQQPLPAGYIQFLQLMHLPARSFSSIGVHYGLIFHMLWILNLLLCSWTFDCNVLEIIHFIASQTTEPLRTCPAHVSWQAGINCNLINAWVLHWIIPGSHIIWFTLIIWARLSVSEIFFCVREIIEINSFLYPTENNFIYPYNKRNSIVAMVHASHASEYGLNPSTTGTE